ncbi:TSUP family transporter [Pontibacillus yanchengensis]|uniref:TSUP family transporter n=2 Tax=Pontibacillus yanchengensis TaxID=462910 RepID=A0ACC7VBU3_9BACI|nr:sulfite exporter TauE/SafE family protein [Pontibacillus yanchengensis]MYL34787.1 TSUP family transporter [Pontibacillus yanchengensis]MYL52227.1 TSUP family transporter [Pontibacillus yanchengensis]
MTLTMMFIVLLVGICAGFINVLAGGGSLLTLPMLIFLNLPSAMANGTNRIAILAQNITAIASFRNSGIFHWKLAVFLSFPAVLGSIAGSKMAIELSDDLFNRILSIVMVFVLITIIVQPQRWFTQVTSNMTTKKRVLLFIVFLLVGFYGGFIQAGVGLVIVMMLTLTTGMNLVHINSLKVFIVAIYTFSSIIVFLINDQIHWGYGLVLALGNSIGAIIGSKSAVKKGEGFVRIVMVVAVLFMSVRLWFT